MASCLFNLKFLKIMKTLLELKPLILSWADEKGLLNYSIAPKQRLKLLEEIGETAKAILRNDISEIKDGIGDVFVVLVILNKQTGGGLQFDFSKVISSEETDLYELLKMIAFVSHSLFCELSLLNDVSNLLGLDLTECANLAWNEIKDRTGKTENGTFIRDK
jgi:hypothetical protein